jgi:hypothetical protein
MAEQSKEATKAEKENQAARDAAYAAGLERELEGYKRAGNKDRVAQVEAELRRVGKGGRKGGAPETTAGSGGPERAVKPSPAKRPTAKKK